MEKLRKTYNMNKYVTMFIIIVLSIVAIIQWIPKKVSVKNKDYLSNQQIIYYFDLSNFIVNQTSSKVAYDYLKVAATLQGLANRNGLKLYYHYGINASGIGDDEFWFNELRKSGGDLEKYQVVRINTFDELISTVKAITPINGVVLWDESVAATSNVASTIAGVENLIPIRYDNSLDSVYTDLVTNKNSFGSVKKNLVGAFKNITHLPNSDLSASTSGVATTGSSKNDAYLWAKINYIDTGKTSKEIMAYTVDSWTNAPSCATGACFTAAYLPEYMTAGEERDVYITVLNNNPSEKWTKEGLYRIASPNRNNGVNAFEITYAQYGFEQGDNVDEARIFLADNSEIKPGDRFTVKFRIKAPSTAGKYYLNLAVVHDGEGWFSGELKQEINVVNNYTSNSNKLYRYYDVDYGDLFNRGIINSDYFIKNKAFFWDLSPDATIAPIDDKWQVVGTDVSTLKQILSSQANLSNNNIFTVIGFVPWHLKYTTHSDNSSSLAPVSAEWTMIDIISKYGGQSDADAAFPIGLANASLYSQIKLNNLKQKNDKDDILNNSVIKEVYDSNTKYAFIYMGDYDCGAWTSGTLPENFILDYGETAKYPLAWPIAGDLSKRVPHVYNWIYANMTSNDYFVAGDNGTGYLNPMQLNLQLLNRWKDKNISSNRVFDLNIQGFLISGNSGRVSNTIQNIYTEITPAGVVYQGGIEGSNRIGNTMFIPHYDVSTEGDIGSNIINSIEALNTQFMMLRIIRSDRTTVYSAIDRAYSLAASKGLKIKIVDPYTLMQLYRDHPTQTKSVSACYTNETNYIWSSTYPSGYIKLDTVTDENHCKAPTAQINSVTTGTESITIVAGGTDNRFGIYGYQFSKDNGLTWTDVQTSNTYTFNKLTTGTYLVKIRTVNNTYLVNGITKNNTKESESQQAKTKNLGTCDITLTNDGVWAQSKVATITKSGNGDLQYRVTNGDIEKVPWTAANNGQTYTINYASNTNIPTVVQCRLTDGTNTSPTIKLQTKVDVTAPTSATLTTTKTTDSITVVANGTDLESGIYGYQFSKDNGATWTDVQTSNTYTFDNLKNGTYSIKIKAINNTYRINGVNTNNSLESAVNNVTTENLGSCNITITNDGEWSQSKDVTITKSGTGILQYKVTNGDVTKLDWTTINSGQKYTINYASNTNTPTSVQCRLTDDTNTTPTIKSQTKVDVTAPTSATLTTTKTTNSITVVANGTDLESGIYGYQFSKDNGATWTGVQTSNTYTFDNLKNGTYSIKIKAINNTYRINGINTNNSLESVVNNVTTENLGSCNITITNDGEWSQSKDVTITKSGTGTLQYKVTNGDVTKLDWTTINSGQKYTINYASNTNTPTVVQCRLTDGTNTTSSSTHIETKIDINKPSACYTDDLNYVWTNEVLSGYTKVEEITNKEDCAALELPSACYTDGLNYVWTNKPLKGYTKEESITTSENCIALADEYNYYLDDDEISINEIGNLKNKMLDEDKSDDKNRYYFTLKIDSQGGYNAESNSYTIICNGYYKYFKGIKIDGILVDNSNYSLKEGSTIVTLFSDYLITLKAGHHKVSLIYDNDIQTEEFEINIPDLIKSEKNPNLGDSIIIYTMLFVVLSSIVIIILKKYNSILTKK